MRQMQLRPKQELNQSSGGRQHAMLGRQHRFGQSAESELRNFGSGGESDMYQGPIYGYLPNSNVFGQRAMDEYQQMTQDMQNEKFERDAQNQYGYKSKSIQ